MCGMLRSSNFKLMLLPLIRRLNSLSCLLSFITPYWFNL
jgi:hypothetical protein